MTEDSRGLLISAGAAALIVGLICGMAMHVTADDNACTAAGGRLEFAATWSTEACVRDGQVIQP